MIPSSIPSLSLSLSLSLSFSHTHTHTHLISWGFPSGSMVKNLPANAGDVRDLDSIPGSGRLPGEGNGKPFQTLAWKIPWTEEPDRLQSIGSQRVRHD